MLVFIRYLQPVLIFPFFLLSLVPRRWATIPLWFLSISICSFPYLITDEHLRAVLGYTRPAGVRLLQDIKDMAGLIIIPVVVQLAAWLRLSVLHKDEGGTSAGNPKSFQILLM
ncbi:MAG TPA: hypothetical protein VFT65_09455 [Candidatus Angelobacter sp.]|nr:hypothetical protein [Candidatus Angelobacter sp.]